MSPDKVEEKKSKNLRFNNPFAKQQLVLFAAVFALMGGYALWSTYAESAVVASLEAEQMILPIDAFVVNDSEASGGKAVRFTASGTAAGNVSLPSSATSVTIKYKTKKCRGSISPSLGILVDGALVMSRTISGSVWKTETVDRSLAAGLHSVSITTTNPSGMAIRSYSCTSEVYIDVVNFNTTTTPPTQAPTLTISASPQSVTTGSASTLTWNSTNATACNASGAWNGSKPLQGSASTGALNTTSTYMLSCLGPGGSTSGSATVAVTVNPNPPPPPPLPPPPPPLPPPSTSNCTPGADWGINRQDLASQVLTLVNQHRSSIGLTQLTASATLKSSAEWKSLHMSKYNYFAHNDPAPPVARSAFQRMSDCGYKGNGAGENIAYGYGSPQAVMNAWLNSPGHKSNIENPSWRAMGNGVASDANGRLYWTQNFGTSP